MPISRSVDKEILLFFKKSKDKRTSYINKLIVSAFVSVHQLNVGKESFLRNYLDLKDNNLQDLINLINHHHSVFGTEELVEVFEYVISPADKEVNGAVYTPAFIRDFIIRNILSRYDKVQWGQLLYADLSCGCGGFFYSLIKIYKETFPERTIAGFIHQNILGVDIKDFSVERTKILLALYALQEGEDLKEEDFNVHCLNSLSFSFMDLPFVKRHGGIDVVMGNPPYVASSKISDENRDYVQRWEVSKTGKADLYLPFYQLGIESLRPGGTLGYIAVNTFYRSLNGYAFRSYLSRRGYDCTIIDFGSEQLFSGCSTYTCISIINKESTGLIHYIETTSNKLTTGFKDKFEEINYSSLDDRKGWVLKDRQTASRIKMIENVGHPLGDIVSIRNGFATLRNEIFLVRPYRETKQYLFIKKDSCRFKIERNICRKAIKANVVRDEKDIVRLSEYIIYPYHEKNGRIYVIEEEKFSEAYPNAYHYLMAFRDELAKRDKGKKKYAAWFAYGRTQALDLKGERLLLPHICDIPCTVYSGEQSLLFYDGYAIFAKSHRQLEVVRRILISDIFWYYITKTSKPYSGGFFSLEKRYIKHFGIPDLTDEQIESLLKFKNQNEINQWLNQFYS